MSIPGKFNSVSNNTHVQILFSSIILKNASANEGIVIAQPSPEFRPEDPSGRPRKKPRNTVSDPRTISKF